MTEPTGEYRRPQPDREHSLAPRKPQTLGGVAYLAVLGATVVGLVMVVLDEWRAGLTVVGVTFLGAAVARLLIADDKAGMLGVRSKVVDVISLALFGTAVVVLTLVIPAGPQG